MKRSIVVAATATIAFTSACASNPALREEPTGARLAVEINERPVTVVERETLVDFGASNGKGGAAGLDIGRDVERERVLRNVQLKQGLRVVDEQDFYAIAGDRAAFKQVEDYRTMGQVMQAGGVGALGLGAIALASGTAAIAFGFAQPELSDAKMGFVMGGFFAGIMPGGVAAGVGYALFSAGGERLEEEMVLPVERAQSAAEAYNAELPGGAVAALR